MATWLSVNGANGISKTQLGRKPDNVSSALDSVVFIRPFSSVLLHRFLNPISTFVRQVLFEMLDRTKVIEANQSAEFVRRCLTARPPYPIGRTRQDRPQPPRGISERRGRGVEVVRMYVDQGDKSLTGAPGE